MRADARATHQSVVTAMDVAAHRVSRRSTSRLSANKQKNKAERGGARRQRAQDLRAAARLRAPALADVPARRRRHGRSTPRSDTGFAILVKKFLDGAFVQKDPRMLVYVPVGIVGAVPAARRRRLHVRVRSRLGGPAGHQVASAHDVFARYLQLPVAFFDKNGVAQLLSRLTYNIEQVAEAATNSITVHRARHADDRRAHRLPDLPQLEADAVRAGGRAARRVPDPHDEPPVPPLQHAHPGIDGRRHARRQGIAGGPAHDQGLQRRGAPGREFEEVNEHNRRELHEAHHGQGRLRIPWCRCWPRSASPRSCTWRSRDVLEKGLTVGEFTSFLAALLMVTAPLRRLVSVIGPLQQGIAAGQSVFEVLDAAAEDKGGDTRARAGARRGRVPRRAASPTTGEGRRCSRESVFVSPPGETVAIVGRSGSGKSTLVSLLPRFHDPDSGAVLLDGIDVREYRRRDLRNQSRMVSQDVMLFNDTIRNNIAFSAPGADAETVRRAAQGRARAGVRRGVAAGTRDADRRSRACCCRAGSASASRSRARS